MKSSDSLPRPHDVPRDLAAFGIALAWALLCGAIGGAIGGTVLFIVWRSL